MPLSGMSRGGRAPFLFESETTELQQDTEAECKPFFVDLAKLSESELRHLQDIGLVDGHDVCLLYDKHEEYLMTALSQPLKASFVSLDSSRPWILYWCLHSLDLLGRLPDEQVLCGCVDTLRACWQDCSNGGGGGGFGGGPGQMAHGAPTYAAILVLCIIATSGDTKASRMAWTLLEEVRMPLLAWFSSLQHDCGFAIHQNGEMDVRATYTIVCCASLLNILTPSLREGALSFLSKCQTYEGGFGGEPGTEAHGGYTYCAVAALQLLSSLQKINVPALRGWLVRRQMTYEGGFHGRSNKLVDGCYSFWQGGALAIVSAYCPNKKESQDPWLSHDSEDDTDSSLLLFDEPMLQRYILLCAQDLRGGLRDKPSKPRDFYHSCYNLSGLSVSQHYGDTLQQYGHAQKSRVAKTHPCYNIRVERVQAIKTHFEKFEKNT